MNASVIWVSGAETRPDVPLSARLSLAQAAAATEALLEAHGAPFDRLAVKCDNIDHGTPEETIRAMFETVARYRGDRESPIPWAYEVA